MSDNLIIAASFQQEHEAHLFISRLRERGIEGYIQDDNISAVNPFYSGAVGGVKVYVDHKDQESMHALLLELKKESTEKGEFGHTIKVGDDVYLKVEEYCPKCDEFTVYFKRSNMLKSLSSLFSGKSPIKRDKMCTACRQTWRE